MTVERIMEELDRAIADNEAKLEAANSETSAPARTNAQIAYAARISALQEFKASIAERQ
ncbi:hypothetical protein [Bradyrhizobium sp. AC87j1]|uniref:hypothetical protein n=1 Tax=Bradyrhizobium sp. AC87j1 TaxID=2055894 RepID=UPI001374A3E4|nr:hypothetical protein [Bradyrhizobium sp. AC87j1]